MKNFLIGLLVGLFLSTTTFAMANSQQIKLVVDGIDITNSFDVAPIVVNNRTMIPARPLAEALGAIVEWDEIEKAIIITSQNKYNDNDSQTIKNNIDLISGKDLKLIYGIDILILNPQKSDVLQLSKDNIVIETNDFQTINGAIYFNKNILRAFNI